MSTLFKVRCKLNGTPAQINIAGDGNSLYDSDNINFVNTKKKAIAFAIKRMAKQYQLPDEDGNLIDVYQVDVKGNYTRITEIDTNPDHVEVINNYDVYKAREMTADYIIAEYEEKDLKLPKQYEKLAINTQKIVQEAFGDMVKKEIK